MGSWWGRGQSDLFQDDAGHWEGEGDQTVFEELQCGRGWIRVHSSLVDVADDLQGSGHIITVVWVVVLHEGELEED